MLDLAYCSQNLIRKVNNNFTRLVKARCPNSSLLFDSITVCSGLNFVAITIPNVHKHCPMTILVNEVNQSVSVSSTGVTKAEIDRFCALLVMYFFKLENSKSTL